MPDFTDEDLRAAEKELEDSIVASYGPAEKWQPKSNNASKCGHPCPFYLWAARARHEDMPSPDAGMPGVWTLGREAENATKIALLSEGWNLHKTEVTFEDSDLDIRGKLDWELSRKTSTTGVWTHPIPTEFKGVSGNYMGQLNSFQDCFDSSMFWVRLWPMQALVYAYLMPEERPLVCLLMRNKTSARPKAIIERTEQHFARLVEMGDVIGEVNRCLRDGGNPEPITYHPTWCQKCDAAAICPTMAHHVYGQAVGVLEDSSVIDSFAEQWAAGAEAKKSSTKAWEEIKVIADHYGLYDVQPGEERSVISGSWRYTVKASAAGKTALKVVSLAEEDEGAVDG